MTATPTPTASPTTPSPTTTPTSTTTLPPQPSSSSSSTPVGAIVGGVVGGVVVLGAIAALASYFIISNRRSRKIIPPTDSIMPAMPGQGGQDQGKPIIGEDSHEEPMRQTRDSVALRYPEEEIYSGNTAGNY